ncbi:MAG: hypothetical protein [Caudoviricetes sp.]|nr:MAG: hypothetical protein [Caudoviricetes sp.]
MVWPITERPSSRTGQVGAHWVQYCHIPFLLQCPPYITLQMQPVMPRRQKVASPHLVASACKSLLGKAAAAVANQYASHINSSSLLHEDGEENPQL